MQVRSGQHDDKSNCEICRGNGPGATSHIPQRDGVLGGPICQTLRRGISGVSLPGMFRCVPIERINALRDETFALRSMPTIRIYRSRQHALAHQLADYLMRYDYIRFVRSPIDTIQMRFTCGRPVGVVSKKVIATIEERTAQHQEALAREVHGRGRPANQQLGIALYGRRRAHQ